MKYEKLNLKKGDPWGAGHVAHIEDGIGRLYCTPTDEKFFDIDYDGIVSLKAEYRGHPTASNIGSYPYSESDMGADNDGSKIDELPEKIVIPEVINGRTVVGFQPGMFYANYRVKEIVFPISVTAIPEAFALEAKYLVSIKNTEQVKELGKNAFRCTRISKALFPNLRSVGDSTFSYCVYMTHADIGDYITNIPKNMFANCLRLFAVNGGASVKTVTSGGFASTRSLRSVPFLPNLTSIGDNGFFGSRIQYDWDSLTDCTFSTKNATPVQDNRTDYWSGVEFTECGHTMNTLMNQKNPKWADEITEWELDGAPLTFSQGCALFSILHIHSAFTGKTYTHPNQLVEEIRNTENGSTVLKNPPANNAKFYFEALGYTTKAYATTITKDIYEEMCAALARGGMAYVAQSTTGNADGGHGVVIYGINEIGEMLVADSGTGTDKVDLYDDLHTYSMPFQNFTGPKSYIVIVEKPT